MTSSKLFAAIALGGALAFSGAATDASAKPVRGGILNYVVGSKMPSLDMHRETTFGVVHPIRPYYSVLIRVDPNDPQNTAKFVCDLCEGGVPKGTEGSTKFTFKIRKNAKFWSDFRSGGKSINDKDFNAKILGDKVTVKDIKAVLGKRVDAYDIVKNYELIIFPPKGVPSARKAFFRMVKSVTAPDANTVVFKLKFPSGAFIPAVALPFNGIYPKAIVEKDPHFFTKQIFGSGPYVFQEYQPGSFVKGSRNPNYYHKGADGKMLPYLDGIRSISAPKMAIRLNAIRGDRAAIEFRGFPPKARDDLKKALGDKIRVQESDWNCGLMFSPNHKSKYFDNPDVRRALTLAVDRWGGSKYLSKIAIVKTVGGIVFPGHPLAATKAELTKIPGFGEDIKKSRAEAKALLKKAGVPAGYTFKFINRGVDQPYKVVGTWLVGQWKKIGLNPKQNVLPSGPYYASLRKKKDFDVAVDFNCQSVINPLADVSKYISDDQAGNNYGNYQDRVSDKLYDSMLKEADPVKVRQKMREYETHTLAKQVHVGLTPWWYKINPHRSYVQGWKVAPSHYLNQSLEGIWCTGGVCSHSK
jgi:peptide/nickel transport system substrate-binding protein